MSTQAPNDAPHDVTKYFAVVADTLAIRVLTRACSGLGLVH
jgi:hypothetical protein